MTETVLLVELVPSLVDLYEEVCDTPCPVQNPAFRRGECIQHVRLAHQSPRPGEATAASRFLEDGGRR